MEGQHHHTRTQDTTIQNCADYRPISIKSIQDRVMEKQIVRAFLYPVLTHPNHSHLFEDQYAFRPTGSTTATLIYLLQTLTELCPRNSA